MTFQTILSPISNKKLGTQAASLRQAISLATTTLGLGWLMFVLLLLLLLGKQTMSGATAAPTARRDVHHASKTYLARNKWKEAIAKTKEATVELLTFATDVMGIPCSSFPSEDSFRYERLVSAWRERERTYFRILRFVVGRRRATAMPKRSTAAKATALQFYRSLRRTWLDTTTPTTTVLEINSRTVKRNIFFFQFEFPNVCNHFSMHIVT